ALDESLCAREINYLASLAGVGVAFKLAQALLNKEIPDNAACNDAKASTSSHFRNDVSFISEILPLVAVGTVADVVPLIGENRYFVAKGLDLIAQGKHYGLTRLLESAGYKPEKGITAENIAFGIAPRINASGRLETTEQAMKILISDNKAEIEMAVQSLNEFNKIRQELCRTTVMEAEAMLVNDRNPAIVLFNKDWHIGIIGIVASKLVEKYYKPAFLMTYSEETRQYRCSARSIEGIHLYDVLNANAELFDGFGGHAMAAGCSFTGSFDEVKAALNRTIKEISAGKELKPFINIDLDLSADEIDENLVAQISQLEPFGAGNPSPVFSVKNLKIKEKRLMGENKDHLRLTCIAGESLPPLTCVRWGQGDVGLVAGDTLDIAFHPQLNEYNGNTSVQLIIDDIHSDCLHEEEVSYKLKFYDHRKKTGILPQVEDYIKNSGQSIAIFAESKPVLDTLQPFKCLSRNIVTRDELKTCDSLMFFDYPADRDTFERILEQASPSAVHFMNYEIRTFDEKDFLKTVSGMLKFAHNSNGGKVELRRCASFLGKSYAVFELLFSIFEETGLISILEKAPDYYRIEYIGNIDLALVLHSEKYAVLLELIDECEQFQKSLMEEELETLI
ncbi:MAG: DHH family phosphoesterase, partial [Heliobacteriaceae bacterium]|nr:DHH family phosphoesterase [Heliobacteriaceae bacterium]